MDSDFLRPSPFIPKWGKRNDFLYYIYNGASMAPWFKPGDMLCVNITSFLEIHPGDVIVFHLETETKETLYIVHRVISVENDGLTTKGDNNAMPDPSLVEPDNFTGRVSSFERQGRLHTVRGGAWGLLHGRVIKVQKIILILTNRMGWRIYRLVRRSGLVAKLWQPAISQIRFKTDHGPLIKYCHGNRTVAQWWPEQKYFEAVKLFDLLIPNPGDPNNHAILD